MHLARAVFASCPTGCTRDEVLSVTAGESIKFNATVIHTSGGSCGFKQEVQHIELMKLNDVHGMQRLSFCDLGRGQEATCNNNDRVSLSGGRNSRYDFVFTLSNAIYIDSGLYRVTIQGEHPATGALTVVSKKFHVTIIMGEYIGNVNSQTRYFLFLNMSNYHNLICSRNRFHQKFIKW